MKYFLAIVALAASASAVVDSPHGGNAVYGQQRTWSPQEVNAARAQHLSEHNRISQERLGALSNALKNNPGQGQHGGDISGPYMAALNQALGRSGLNIPDGYYDNRQHAGNYRAQAAPQGHAHQISAPAHHAGLNFQGNQRQWNYADVEKERSAHLQEHSRQYQAALQAASQANSRNPGGHQDDGSYDARRYEQEGQH